jgi:hypothetical protein
LLWACYSTINYRRRFAVYSLDLNHKSPAERIRFDWEPSTGTVTGPGAEYVRKLIALWYDEADGLIMGRPEPGTCYKTGHPLNDPAGMFIVLSGMGYDVPEWLAAFAPDPAFADETPEGACN